MSGYPPAPEWHTSAWLNCETPLSLSALRGRVVVVEAFQMPCPACVLHALPQAQRRTMRAYAMQGTPTTVLIDAAGRLPRQWFGAVDDLELGLEVGQLLAEVPGDAPQWRTD
ncbi:MAG: hypothetical protein IRZ06_03070 [Nevskia sp.]|nr:hypothetical protein [Nevskia sp.]